MEIGLAISRGKAWLYEQQKDGNWEEVQTPQERDKGDRADREKEDQWGGRTAIACYALLATGEHASDERLKPAIEFLKTAPIKGVYALALRAQVWSFLPQSVETRQLLRRDADALLNMMQTAGKNKGLYDYIAGGKNYSMSRSHFGVLGVWAAALAGTEIKNTYWQIVEEAWLGQQQSDGGWRYNDLQNVTEPGLTAAGVATLFVTQDFLRSTEGISCGAPTRNNPAIEKGMKFLVDQLEAKPIDGYHNPNATLYAIERVGLASGLRRFGETDWYQKGAEYLVGEQTRTGSWRLTGQISSLPNTAFSLIFLGRGRAPVVMNKLNYSTGVAKAPAASQAKWNQRPRDVANISRWIARQLERDLTWQSISTNSPIEEWHDAPIVYLSGSELPELDRSTKDKLKLFVEQGGMLLGNADCAATSFAGLYRKLGMELFPDYEFRELPESHPIYIRQQFPRSNWKTKPAMLGLSNGVRELMLSIPQTDAGKAWQSGAVGGKEEPWQLAADIYLYAVDRSQQRFRGETHLIPRVEGAQAAQSIKMARVQYPGNWNPEPGGWRRLSNFLFNRNKVDLTTEPVKLKENALDGFKLAHLTGTTPLKLDAAAVAELKRFVETGGLLVIDAAGGSTEFGGSIDGIVPQLSAGEAKTIDLKHPLFASGPTPLQTIGWRSIAASSLGVKRDSPRLRVIEMDGRPAIIYSREDLSAGLVGNSVDGVIGYNPDTATEIMARIILLAQK